MQDALLKGEEQEETDIAAPDASTELSSSHRLTNELVSQWENDAQRLAQLGAHPQAELLRQCSKELFEAMKAENDVLLTLTMAAQLCGYSPDYLGRLVREGTIPNHGRKGSPKVRRGDLPKKPVVVAGRGNFRYDPSTDARFLRSRGRRVS
jgi:hypothetical protein